MADMQKEIDKIKKKNKRLSYMTTPIRALHALVVNPKLAKKEKTEINKLIMQVDDLKGDAEKRKHDQKIKSIITRINRDLGYKEAERTNKIYSKTQPRKVDSVD